MPTDPAESTKTSDSVADATVDPREAANFERLADLWWDDSGPFWPLHRLNGFRLDYIRRQLDETLAASQNARALRDMKVLDIGCGGGILSESVARLGPEVTGIDVVSRNIGTARTHARRAGLDIDYRLVGAEELADQGRRFDVVLNMEVVEHVQDLPRFLAACGRLVRPGGLMFAATINRTAAAWLFAILGAEYILRWLPKGTHRWRKFVTPAELETLLSPQLQVRDRTGVRVNPFTRRFSHTASLGVNYMMLFARPQG